MDTKKIIQGTTLTVLTAVAGATGDYYVNPRVDLIVEKVTPYEYDQIKPELIEKVDKKEVEKTTLKEKQMWVGSLKEEARKCRGKVQFKGINNENSIEKLNEFLKESDCNKVY